ncbi:MAG: glycosyltransferase family 39 protein [Chitinophagaceae bacterium]|nr:glycosyltransferase family 39 protein [Chitinophagaceae bacterium]
MTIGARSTQSDKLFSFFLFISIGVNATGLFNEIIEPDAALYAGIAKRMAITNDWVNLYGDGYDWLDKPHFPFWMAAASFKVFGINAFAYKLPAFLFWLCSLRFTWLLARSLFDKGVAQIAVIIYATALHVVISNFDVRAEPYLTCCIAGSIYYMYMADKNGRLVDVLLAAIWMACAIMTKGIFVTVTIGGGFVLYWVFKKEWKQFFNYKWWLLLLFTFVLILPELYCLYIQFDMHPEKVIFGKRNVSGVRFFFWDSQFGRFFNSGPIKGKGDYFFFFHTTIWAFIPWSILFSIAVFKQFNRNFFVPQLQWILYGSAAITFLLFTFSSFQLPHYIIIIFPHFAILTATYLNRVRDEIKRMKNLLLIQSILLGLAGVLLIGLILLYNFRYTYAGAAFVLIVAGFLLTRYRKPILENILIKTVLFSSILYLFLNLFFYPAILRYQSGMMAGKWIQETNAQGPIAIYRNFSYSFEFYAPGIIMQTDDRKKLDPFARGRKVLIYTAKENIKELEAANYSVELLQSFSHFPVSKLDIKFLTNSTRQTQVKEMVLVRVLLPSL